MPEPVIFSAAHPVVIRPTAPSGFVIETRDGQVLAVCATPFDRATFRLVPVPPALVDGVADGVSVLLQLEWIEG